MHMHKERLQILVDREQRRGLDAEADRLGTSVGAVVRQAIDTRLGGTERRRRLKAVEEMSQAASGEVPSLERIERILDEERAMNRPPRSRDRSR